MDELNNVNSSNTTPLEEQIKELQARNLELENNWKRALADYRNFQKRMDDDRQSFISYATMSLLTQLLPVLDNLELVEKHNSDAGLKMIIKELKQILQAEGIEELNPVEQMYDLQTMEAIELVEGEENRIVEVLSKGYFLKGKLVRPARVKVGKGNLINKEEI